MSTKKHPMAVLVGSRLRVIRIRRGLETIQVAERLGFDRQTIITWENGFSFPPIPKLIELCRLYQCSTDEIIKGKELVEWEDAVAMIPADLREKTLIIHRRPVVGDLVANLDSMTDEQLSRLECLIPQLALVGENGMAAVGRVITGLADLISSTAQHTGVHSTERRLKVV